ncbi:putative interleukin-17 receptor E-like isoform X2 [Salarias fasciatus]|uniref:Interleukin-17 receptor C/E N-terminal domain-containing protein n=1 Tax=Salarias fasciatus TaxID=181472 RepID=A0A672IKC5_SALFA|nr:putative interleukin-17 receptor E-like isoform X2 [Salarias fasciatus]
MILWAALLMAHSCWALDGAAAGSTGLERIEKCSTQCSQKLRCKSKPDHLFRPPCQNLPEALNTSSSLHNISLSTVMRCEGRQKCSLHLQIKTVLQLSESIHGVSICTTSPGTITTCQSVRFTKASRERMNGLKVEVVNDCTPVYPSQQVQVTVETVPSYCGVTLTDVYQAPDCSGEDLRRHVPECITGRLSYTVNPEKKELSVSVSEMLDGHNYHLRLCHKNLICFGTGANALIKKEEPIKAATLRYSQPLPCLCIEGWSTVMDAPRVQVCPFSERVEELWTGITFDPLEENLIWKPACPVTAVASLCQKRDDRVCVDLPGSPQNVSREKMVFSEVDPHPDLCVKFTSGSRSWTRCPFADRRLQAWEVVVMAAEGQRKVNLLSQITATFSVGLCVKPAASHECHVTETHSLQVEKHKAVDLNLGGKMCNFCVQVKRLDVKFAATTTDCFEQCDESPDVRPAVARRPAGNLTWVIPATICLAGVIGVTLVLHLLLTVRQKRKQKENRVRSSRKKIDCALDCVVSGLKTQPIVHGKVLLPDSTQSENTEKANLISN